MKSPAAPTGSPSTDASAERIKLMRDSLLNYSAPFVSGLINLALIPLMLHHLGAQMFGLWVAVIAVVGLVASVDLGLGWSVTREVAARRGEVGPFVGAALKASSLIALASAFVIALAGLPLSGVLRLTSISRPLVVGVFGIAAIGFVGERLMSFSESAFYGLRRFGLASVFAIAGNSLRAAGTIVLLEAGFKLVAVMVCQAAVSVATGAASLLVVRRTWPQLELGGRAWKLLRPHVSFSIASQLSTTALTSLWLIAPLLIGVARGPAAIVPYHLGRKFPDAVLTFSGQSAGTLFPAASESIREPDPARIRDVLTAGTRWLAVTVSPLCVVLFLIAPRLLATWLGHVPPHTTAILRLLLVAAMVESIGAGAMSLLWGIGAARFVASVLLSLVAALLVLSPVLLHLFGLEGPVYALLICLPFSVAALVHRGARVAGLSLRLLAKDVLRGLPLPLLGAGLVTGLVVWLLDPLGWAPVLITAAAGLLAYCLLLYKGASTEEERFAMRRTLAVAGSAVAATRKRRRRAAAS